MNKKENYSKKFYETADVLTGVIIAIFVIAMVVVFISAASVSAYAGALIAIIALPVSVVGILLLVIFRRFLMAFSELCVSNRELLDVVENMNKKLCAEEQTEEKCIE